MASGEAIASSIALFFSVLTNSDCTIDLNLPQLQYLSDRLTQEECRELVAALHFRSYDVPRQVAAAERKLPENVPCLELLFHWNSEVGEGRGGTHVEVSHRLNQIGRRDLAEWLSRTVFHELSKDLDESLAFEPTEEMERRPTRVTEPERKQLEDEAPWLNLDSVMAVLFMLTLVAFSFGCIYLFCLCCARITGAAKQIRYSRIHKEKTETDRLKKELYQKNRISYSGSEEEASNLVSTRN